MDKIPMTAAGYSALEEELKHRQQVERPRIIQQISDARTHGDISENAEYHAAKEQQAHNEGRIAELEDKLARAEVIDVSKLSGDTVNSVRPSPWSTRIPRKSGSGRSWANPRRTPKQGGFRSPRRLPARWSARRREPRSRW